jgi:hypothetical protein
MQPIKHLTMETPLANPLPPLCELLRIKWYRWHCASTTTTLFTSATNFSPSLTNLKACNQTL